METYRAFPCLAAEPPEGQARDAVVDDLRVLH